MSIQELPRNAVHQALEKSKIRKKADDYVFEVQNKMGSEVIVKATYTVSPDLKTLAREGTAKRESGEPNHFKEVLEKVE